MRALAVASFFVVVAGTILLSMHGCACREEGFTRTCVGNAQ